MSDKEKLEENKQPSVKRQIPTTHSKAPQNSKKLTKEEIKNQLPKNPPKPPSK